MTKKKKKKSVKKTPSAFSRMYPPVPSDWPKKRKKKNETIDEKSRTDEGNQQAGETKQ